MPYLDDQTSVFVYRDRANKGMENHFHYVNEIILCHEGEAIFNINGTDYTFEPHSILFIGNLESHSVRVSKVPYDRSVILIKNTFITNYLRVPLLVSMLSNHLQGFPYVFPLAKATYNNVRSLFEDVQEEFEQQNSYWEEILAGKVSELMIKLYRSHPDYFKHIGESESSSTVMDVQIYINEHYTEDLSIQELSEKFYTSPSSLSRDFKQFTGHTVKTYIILNRILRAKYLLQTTRRSMNSIGEEVGYDNPNHFSRIFKKYTGFTPQEYRNQRKE